MTSKKEKQFQIIAIILCCVFAVLIVTLLVYSSEKYKTPSNTMPSVYQSSEERNSESVPQTEESTTESTTEDVTTPEDSVTVLVNKDNKIPADWEVDLVKLKNNQSIDRRAYDDLQKMFDDARAAGYQPLITSSYRTNDRQTQLYNNKVNQYVNQGKTKEEARELAGKWVAIPGTSEHQLGLAADIVSVDNQKLDESQLNSPCQLWLIENSRKYGFILRYPDDKKDITNINFEPWHYRYVGKDAAKVIHDEKICLEEYVAKSNA